MVKVSVLLPVYNGASTLRETLDSVLAQKFDSFEVLISDDNSRDDSARIIEEYVKRDARLRPFRFSPGKGLAGSLNFLIQEARGEYLMRIDQDDVCVPERMRTQADYLDAHPEVAVVGSQAWHMGVTPERDHLISLPTGPEQIFETLRNYNCLYHPATMLRKSMIVAAGGYRPEFKNAEDYDLWLRLSRKHPLVNLPQPLLRYRFSTGGMTLSRKWEQLYFVNLAQVADLHPGKPLSELAELARQKHEGMGKEYFLGIVYKGTIEELQRLGFRREAFRMWRRMFREVGWKPALREVLELLKRA